MRRTWYCTPTLLVNHLRQSLIIKLYYQINKLNHTQQNPFPYIHIYIRSMRLNAALPVALGQERKRAIDKMANGVTRVIHRCEAATETGHLDLSGCELLQMPDAVFHLLRNTCLQSADLSANLLSKIPPKLSLKFSSIKELRVSKNRLGKLPEELSTLVGLERVDISHNAFLFLPTQLFRLPQLKQLHAHHNHIQYVDVEKVKVGESLELLDLRDNPLDPLLYPPLTKLSFSVLLSPLEQEDPW